MSGSNRDGTTEAHVEAGGSASDHRDRRVIGVVSFAHGLSHFTHLLLAPLFPWLKDAFSLSYAELGLLMTVFFVVSGIGQFLAGFVVDRVGPVPVLLGALSCFVLACLLLAAAPSYAVLCLGAALAGIGNAPFHPIDFSILNSRVATPKLGHAYAIHGLSGSIGWAVAPVYLAGIAGIAGWRSALFAAAGLCALVSVVVFLNRRHLSVGRAEPAGGGAGADGGRLFGFLGLPAVWLSFLFFTVYALAMGGVQSFAPTAAGALHSIPLSTVALCLTSYMLASALGMIGGGFLAKDPARAERVIAAGFGGAGLVALSMVLVSWPAWFVPVVFAVMGLAAGSASPARDQLVRRASPPGATGRVYGVVYSGLDVGMAFGPVLFGFLMDSGRPAAVWVAIAVFQMLLIASAFFAGARSRARLVSAGA
ncbi:MAG: MFS transporter [Burkholderiaceae bacterium]|nr:MFS transporter [Burkholderiaceae bacterium]